MAKVYTAREMRQRADLEQHSYRDNITAAMLRQAADAMELIAKLKRGKVVVLRREVGEWKEVK